MVHFERTLKSVSEDGIKEEYKRSDNTYKCEVCAGSEWSQIEIPCQDPGKFLPTTAHTWNNGQNVQDSHNGQPW